MGNVGYTHIDTAYDYQNQRGVSVGLEKSGKKRNEVFVTTKVPGCGLQGIGKDRCYEDTLKLIKEDVAQLSTSYDMQGHVDLVLIHFPPCTEADPAAKSPLDATCFTSKNGCDTDDHVEAIQAQWKAMETAYKTNLTCAIGVSNYCSKCLSALMAVADVAPMVNQVQYHVGMGPDPEGFKSLADRMGIVLQAWSPLGHGGHGSQEILNGALTTSIGQAHGKSAAQVALKWIVSNDLAVATKSSSEAHLAENLNIFDFDLSKDDVTALNAADFASKDTPSFLCSDAAFDTTVV